MKKPSQELANFVVSPMWEDLPSSGVRAVEYLLINSF